MDESKKDTRDEVIAELQQQLKDALAALKKAKKRIEQLEKELGKSPSTRLDESFSMNAEEKRQKRRSRASKAKKTKVRKGRLSKAQKIEMAVRTEQVFPEGVSREDCQLSHTRPIWRFENGQTVMVAYEVYRGSKDQYGQVPGAFGRSEFGIEIVITLAFLVYGTGLSFDKACLMLNFFQGLQLRKSQVDALLKQLARHWEQEFEVLCTLLANSAVVHADETSWSIHSVWAFLSENARLIFSGVPKDANTLAAVLNPKTFAGTVISDDAAVYANFSSAQKCWAHLLRKAIKLTLMEPENHEYREFTDRLLEIYKRACRIQADGRLSEQGRRARVAKLEDEILSLCAPMWIEELPPQEDEARDDYRKLANELMRLRRTDQLFTFVTGGIIQQPNGETSVMAGTNNEAERTLRSAANARKTGRTSKTLQGAKRRTVIESVLESLRVHLPEFTLTGILDEIANWSETGRSCFRDLLQRLKLPPPETGVLKALFPPPAATTLT